MKLTCILCALLGTIVLALLLNGCTVNQLSQEDELNVALLTAQAKLKACGISTPSEITITEVPIERFPSTVVCAFSMPGLPQIYLNQGRMLFYPGGPCGPDYQYTIGHELLHIVGYTHNTSLETLNFKNILRNCDLQRPSEATQ